MYKFRLIIDADITVSSDSIEGPIPVTPKLLKSVQLYKILLNSNIHPLIVVDFRLYDFIQLTR